MMQITICMNQLYMSFQEIVVSGAANSHSCLPAIVQVYILQKKKKKKKA